MLYQLGPFKLPDPNDPEWRTLHKDDDLHEIVYDNCHVGVCYRPNTTDHWTVYVKLVDLMDCGVTVPYQDYEEYARRVWHAMVTKEKKANLNIVTKELASLKDE